MTDNVAPPQANPLAQQLSDARLSGTSIDPKSVKGPADIAAAYALQDAVEIAIASMIRGWKLGATNEVSQKILGTPGPFFGPILNLAIFESGDTVPSPAPFLPGVEGEIVLHLGKDLPAREAGYTLEDVTDAVSGISAGVEIAGSRFDNAMGDAKSLLLIADGGANVAFINGDVRSDWRSIDLESIPVSMTVNGEETGAGKSSNALGNPLNALLWLANEFSLQGRSLEAGMFITTGTITGFARVKSGDKVRAEFGPLGAIEITIG
jgi:2-keto-4-pentenoate hydratase